MLNLPGKSVPPPIDDMVNPIVREAARRIRDAEDQFLIGNPGRAIELLEEAVALCEEHELLNSYPYLKAHIDLYRILRATGHRREATSHFDKAVSLGANPSLLQTELRGLSLARRWRPAARVLGACSGRPNPGGEC